METICKKYQVNDRLNEYNIYNNILDVYTLYFALLLCAFFFTQILDRKIFWLFSSLLRKSRLTRHRINQSSVIIQFTIEIHLCCGTQKVKTTWRKSLTQHSVCLSTWFPPMGTFRELSTISCLCIQVPKRSFPFLCFKAIYELIVLAATIFKKQFH